MILIALVTILVLLLIYKYIQIKYKYHEISKLPGPKPLPIIGNVFEFKANPIDIHKSFRRLTKEYGRVFIMYLGFHSPVIVVSDANFLQNLLSSSVHINKSTMYEIFSVWLGQGLALAGGETWRKNRRIITPAFHFKILEQFVPIFESNAKVLLEKLKKQVGKDVDIFEFIRLFALDSIAETSMGIQIDAQNNPDIPYAKTTNIIAEIAIKRVFSIIQRKESIAKYTALYREQVKHIQITDAFIKNVIKQRMEEKKKSKHEEETNEFGIKRKIAFLDLLLNSNEASCLTVQQIRDEVETFMFAGHDTISSGLSFMFCEISKRPEIQEKLYEELQENGLDDPNSEIAFSRVQNLKYMECVIKETLRMYTVTPFIERRLTEDMEYDGMVIPKGTTININLDGLHNDEKYFKEPKKFNPERFLTDEIHPYAFVPFSAGPRNCIGQKYAMYAMKIVITSILRNFKIEPVPGFEMILGQVAVLKSMNGFHVILKNRQFIK